MFIENTNEIKPHRFYERAKYYCSVQCSKTKGLCQRVCFIYKSRIKMNKALAWSLN